MQVVDIVIEQRREVLDLQHQAGILVTNFDAHPLGAFQDVLPAQKIERSAGPAKLIASCHGSRICGKTIHQQARFTKAGGLQGLVVQVGAVQSAVHLRQAVIGIPDFKIAPEPVSFIFLSPDIELARGGCILDHGAVVTEGRVVVIRVHAPEQGIG